MLAVGMGLGFVCSERKTTKNMRMNAPRNHPPHVLATWDVDSGSIVILIQAVVETDNTFQRTQFWSVELVIFPPREPSHEFREWPFIGCRWQVHEAVEYSLNVFLGRVAHVHVLCVTFRERSELLALVVTLRETVFQHLFLFFEEYAFSERPIIDPKDECRKQHHAPKQCTACVPARSFDVVYSPMEGVIPERDHHTFRNQVVHDCCADTTCMAATPQPTAAANGSRSRLR